MHDSSPGEGGQLRYLFAVAGVLFAGLLFYSQTRAFSWDEGFHLVAAQLILAGKRPYLDFCFPQTPLNAYLTAGWMRLFGDTWRAVHVLEAVCVAAAAFLTADFVRSRFPDHGWRWGGALAALIAVGMNSQVVIFGTIGQSYGLCLFLIVAAYRLAVMAVERPGVWMAGATGFLAGAAAGSSLLTAPVGPGLLIWLYLCNRAGNRWAKMATFLAGGAVSWLPIAWLYRQGPEQTIFNVILYQLKYRHKWNGAAHQDINVLSSWINSAQGLSLALLAAAGLWFLIRRSDWDRERREEIYLSLWLALGLSVELATAHPTFERYFLLMVPFVVVPAIAGLYAVGIQLLGPGRPLHAAYFLIVITILGLVCLAGHREDRSQGGRSHAAFRHHLGRRADLLSDPPPGTRRHGVLLRARDRGNAGGTSEVTAHSDCLGTGAPYCCRRI
jgi:4-amino-4-deoxy-L-arabinose transferase-like glycosyltransferase